MAFDDIAAVDITQVSGSDLSAAQYKLVTLASDGQVDVAAASNTDDPVGFLQTDPAATPTSGQAVAVRIFGVTKAIADGVIQPGALLMPSNGTAGSVETLGATNRIAGRYIGAAATTTGDIISVLAFCFGQHG